MINKIKSIVFIGAFSALIALFFQINAYAQMDTLSQFVKVAKAAGFSSDDNTDSKYHSKSCTNGNCASERKELTPAEKECYNDIRSFLFSYEIIRGMHDRYAKEFGSIPTVVQQDLADADSAYYAMQKYVGNTKLMATYLTNAVFWLGFYKTPSWALEYCKEMYNQEMNSMFGSRFSPTSNDQFLKNNYVCNTSYKDALQNIRRLLSKYRNGHRCE